MEKLLSIAIPTYNRSKYLREELENIIPQLIPYKAEVEIAISDNASTDNTGEVVAELSRKYDFPILYKHLETNIYFEDNFESAVNLTSGKYVQMAGDDDLMAPGFYDVLWSLIKHNYGLIHFNRLSCDVNCCNGKIYDKQYKEAIFKGPVKEFVERVGTGPGFMTSLVFRRDCWDEGLKYKNKLYYGYNFLGQLYQGAMHLKVDCCYYYFPIILQRGNAHGFSKTYPLCLFVALPSILHDVDEEFANSWIEKHLRGKRKTLVLASVFNNKPFYKEHADEMTLYLAPKQKNIFNFMVSQKTPVILCRIYYRLLSWVL